MESEGDFEEFKLNFQLDDEEVVETGGVELGLALTAETRRVLKCVEQSLPSWNPILLLGETGCGKTTIVQKLAASRNQTLRVLNFSKDSDEQDLLG